jgi:hypothetical protein
MNRRRKVMKRKFSWLVLIAGLVLCFGMLSTHMACSCGDDDGDDNDDPSDEVAISPSECDALIISIYDVCQSDVNTWVRDAALEYCYADGGADWVCLQVCANQFANDCQEIFSCSLENCS